MELSAYVGRLRNDLTAVAAGDPSLAEAIARTACAVDSAIRITLLEALADAAAEISSDLPGGAVELRLRGREPEFVVTAPADHDDQEPPPAAAAPPDDLDDESSSARLTLRLPEALKQRVDEAATRARLSTNTWLVEAIRGAVQGPEVRRRGRGRQVSGWAR